MPQVQTKPKYDFAWANSSPSSSTDAGNEEDLYEAGAISALVDLLLEDDEHLKVEALNALINISVSRKAVPLHESKYPTNTHTFLFSSGHC